MYTVKIQFLCFRLPGVKAAVLGPPAWRLGTLIRSSKLSVNSASRHCAFTVWSLIKHLRLSFSNILLIYKVVVLITIPDKTVSINKKVYIERERAFSYLILFSPFVYISMGVGWNSPLSKPQCISLKHGK